MGLIFIIILGVIIFVALSQGRGAGEFGGYGGHSHCGAHETGGTGTGTGTTTKETPWVSLTRFVSSEERGSMTYHHD